MLGSWGARVATEAACGQRVMPRELPVLEGGLFFAVSFCLRDKMPPRPSKAPQAEARGRSRARPATAIRQRRGAVGDY
eukprot:2483912-Alexandrium_andersonii.AAC.1